MSMDLQRFHATFFEESREGLDAMEAGLLALESGQQDAEIINSVFRAAHSIKGGAGTFGFDAIAGLTHVLETLLDELRAGKRPWKATPSTPCCPRWTCCAPAARSRTRPGCRSGCSRCGEGAPGSGSFRPGRSERPVGRRSQGGRYAGSLADRFHSSAVAV